MLNKQSFKERYDIFLSNLTTTREMISNLNRRYQIFRRKCENSLFLSLFYKRRLHHISDSLKEVYSLYDEVNRKSTFILGMISNAYFVDDPYIDKTINHAFDEIDLLNKKLEQINLSLQKCEKK